MNYQNNLDTLLDLDGEVIRQTGGYWVKIEARRVTPTEAIPHGIRYSLTLHEPSGRRIMGFDNAHAIKRKLPGKHQAQKTYDHRHRHEQDKGVAYEFSDPIQLLTDFWNEVDKILNMKGLTSE